MSEEALEGQTKRIPIITEDFGSALKDVDDVNNYLESIARRTVLPKFKTADDLIEKIKANLNSLTIEEIRNYSLDLSLCAYDFSVDREMANMKAAVAEAIRKEKQATCIITTEGTVSKKENEATLQIGDQLATEILEELISGLYKAELDSIKGIIDTLKTNLISLQSEAKLNTGISLGGE